MSISTNLEREVIKNDLPLLAAKAALELDSYRLNNASSLSTVQLLFNFFRSSLDYPLEETSKEKFTDYEAAVIVGNVLDPGGQKTVKDIVRDVYEKMESYNSSNNSIIAMRDFFVSLSDAASLYQEKRNARFQVEHPDKI